MNCILTKLSFLLTFLVLANNLQAQSSEQYWKSANSDSIASLIRDSRDIIPQKAYTFELNLSKLQRQLSKAPLRFSKYNEENLPIISLPMPNGDAKQFKVVEAPVMHPDLQSRFPEIRSYAGYELRNPSVTIRFDISPNGLSAMILSDKGTFFIDPYSHLNTRFYTSYDKKDFVADKNFTCQLEHSDVIEDQNALRELRTGDGFMRKYRLALGANAEYSNYHGGTVAKVIAAMNKTMTRVNGVYEKEFSVTMEIIANTDKLIFFSTTTDGYTNDSGSKMLTEHQSKCDALIGTANYDIGHVFSTGGGGIANLQAPCKSGTKARGVTGSPTPKGDPFDIDYVAHEMGHQYGGEHTFNNSCSGNRASNAAFEPGSGSTIMAYAGICSPNVQNNSDAYFHAMSISQINAYVITGTGNTCPQKLQTSNLNTPTVNAGADYTIPKDTPFELTGAGSDVESPSADLTYCWEQYDNEIVAMPPSGNLSSGPLFRSVTPTKTTVRVFPNITNIVKNTKNTWEVLSKVGRTLNFRLTVRDNDVNGGRSSVDAMRITVTDDGPFLVTHPDTAKIVWVSGQKQTVKWNIANTNTGLINTPQVMILLSSDGGYTYPDTLAKAVANIGTAIIQVPDKNIPKARIKIKGVNNVFFDISNNDFSIEKPLIPSFLLKPNITEGAICNIEADSINYDMEVSSIAGFNEKVKLIAEKLPSGALISFSQDTITPTGKIKMTIYNLRKTNPGDYSFNILGNSGTLKDSIALKLVVFQKIIDQIRIVKPLAFERGFGPKTPFIWRKLNQAERYTIEISKNDKFQPIEESATVIDTQYVAKTLSPIQVYFWRIRASNPCNKSDVSSPIVFQTSASLCDTITNNLAVDIPATVNEISSQIEVTRKAILGEINVYTRIDHTYMSDLEASIESPNGTRATLFSNICADRNNADATFDDYGNPISCTLNTITLRGRFKSKDPLSTFIGETMKGNWTLRIKDNKSSDAGSLKNWNIRVCNDVVPDAGFIVETDTLKALAGEINNIGQDLLVATSIGSTPDKITYKITALPIVGKLKKGSSELSIGSLITQQEINTGALFYTCDENTTEKRDSFVFESTTTKGGWIPSTTFYLNIVKNVIKLSSEQVNHVSCFGGSDGKVIINAIGGQEPLTYSINGGIAQSSKEFNNLTSGLYNVLVKDALGFNSTLKVTITQPKPIIASAKIDSNNVLINIEGGTSPYQINYDQKGFSSNNSFTNQVDGWHYFMIKDANDCETKDSFKLKINTLNIKFSFKKPTCSNASDAILTVEPNGGRSPYEYALGNTAFQKNNVFSSLAAGIYKISVRDADSLLRSLDVNIIAPSAIVATAKTQRDSLVMSANGGTPPYQYSIDNGLTFQANTTFTKIANGSYSLVVRDANGCTSIIEKYQFTDVIEKAEALGISFMPNPTNDVLNIAFNKAPDYDTNLEVINLQGQTILQDKITNGNTLFTLRVNHLPQGLYFIVLKNPKFETNHKMLIIF